MSAAGAAAGAERSLGALGDAGCTPRQALCNETVNASPACCCRVTSGLGSWTLGCSAASSWIDLEKTVLLLKESQMLQGNRLHIN